MLTYFNRGPRSYYEKPIPEMRRLFWEFQAVIEGRIGKTDRSRHTLEDLSSQRLWLSPPQSDHAWTGEPGKEATIVVFHFRFIPEVLLRAIPSDSGGISVQLNAKQCGQLRDLADKVEGYWNDPAPGMVLCYEHALLELSLLVYELWTDAEDHQNADMRQSVEDALAWAVDHMKQNPSISEIARQAHVSVSHLRRLFHEAFNASPKEVFDQVRFQRAMQLLTDTDMKLVAICSECGFNDQSTFSRAFKRRFGCSPIELRKRLDHDDSVVRF
ncbi:helix-turn-helix transcriptional regulator [Coraliomargarita parva]|uniref:helix-turn-helix transcriptional regulator n=1 Tax=Coraliomargarita parva TaxID=3014050 RepID=UPI0022B3CD70|nr:helix-turn-helix transcriptional regulator [Coraliomargarita parva]